MAHNVWVLCYTPYQAKSVKDVKEASLALAVHRMLHIQECADTLPGFSRWVQYNKRPTHNTQTITTTSISFWSQTFIYLSSFPWQYGSFPPFCPHISQVVITSERWLFFVLFFPVYGWRSTEVFNRDQVFLLRNLHKFLDAVMLTFLKLEELRNLEFNAGIQGSPV